jgi:hypothetical protein
LIIERTGLVLVFHVKLAKGHEELLGLVRDRFVVFLILATVRHKVAFQGNKLFEKTGHGFDVEYALIINVTK